MSETNPPDWQQVKELVDAALELPASERAAFLDRSCASDEALRAEVESLIASCAQAGSLMETPAVQSAAKSLVGDQKQFSAGQRLDHYEIVALLGEGGMGEVYLAKDNKLGRKVAIKVLPHLFARDASRLRRFRQEARTASALNHPNICVIHEIGETDDGRHYISMEYIEGVTLREKIHDERTELTKLLRYLQHVAEGLAKAHAAGIVHRDLKPDNIMITRDGHAKVLDFGLAKLVEPQRPFESPQVGSSEIDTAITLQQSTPGTVIGTVGYMSPEQASGRVNEIDQRSDIFSFGCVLFEVATGQRPFEGKDALDSLHKIVHAPTPQLTDRNPLLPADLQRIVRRCLAKEPEKRYQSIKDVAIELEELLDELKGRAELEYSVQPASSTESTSASARADEGFWVAVLPFKYSGAQSDLQALAEGLTEDIVTGLSRFSYLRVIARSSTQRYTSEGADIRTVGIELGARYVMDGSIRQAGTKLRFAVQLVDATTGAHLWAETYERSFDPDALFELQDDLAPRIVTTVADMQGVLVHSVGNALRDRSPEQLSPYEAVLRSFAFAERATPEAFADALSILELAVRKAPNYGDAWAGLASMCIEDYGQSFNHQADPLIRGASAARRAVELGPANHLAYFALARVLFFQKEFESFRNAAERAVALNPMDGNSIAHIGEMLTYAGEWERGLKLTERATQLNPNHPGWYWFAGFYHAYEAGDYRAALSFALRVNLPGLWVQHMMIAAACGQLGERETASKAVQELLKLRPDFASRVRRDIEKWWDSAYVERLIDGVRKAGLEVQATRNQIPSATSGTPPVSISTQSSTAEYIISEIKDHKRGIAVGLLAFILLLTGSLAYYFYSGRGNSRAAIDSIAVLPLSNTANDPNTEYLSDGIAESIISNLSRLPQLKVMARSSVFHFKGKETDAREVGRQLGVRAVMSGRLLREGDHLIVRAELVNVADGAQLWGADYDRKLSDVLALQQEISREISVNLRLTLTGEERKRLAERDTNNAEAYQLYLLGRFHWSKFTEEGERTSIDYFNQALAKDPNYALAYHGLSDAYQVLGQIGFRPNEVLPKALVYADKALAVDPTLPEAHLSRGACELWYGWNWTMAEQELKRAMELNPNLADPHDLYGQFLSGMGRFDEAIAENKRAVELDPLSPVRNSSLAGVYYWSRQYDLAIGQGRKAMELETNFSIAPQIIGQAYGQQGKYPEAIAQLIKTRDLPGGFAPATSELGYVYAVTGRRTEAQKMLQELQERAKRDFVDPYYIAIIHLGLGEQEQTFAWLNKAYEERSYWLLWLKVEPKFDRLHSDKRFLDLQRSLGLPE